jgi:hypothetical protein
MDLETILAAKDSIVDDAVAALDRANLKHHAANDAAERRARLLGLLELLAESVRVRDLVPVIDQANRIATERFHAGYDISEVQTALNVLEETIWHRVVAGVPKDDLAEALGLVTTVVGAGKDALARTYVSLATEKHVPTLDLNALFSAG